MSSEESHVRVPVQIQVGIRGYFIYSHMKDAQLTATVTNILDIDQATEEGDGSRPAEEVPTVLDEWDGVLLGSSGPGSGHSGWEVISKELSHCGSSPRYERLSIGRQR